MFIYNKSSLNAKFLSILKFTISKQTLDQRDIQSSGIRLQLVVPRIIQLLTLQLVVPRMIQLLNVTADGAQNNYSHFTYRVC